MKRTIPFLAIIGIGLIGLNVIMVSEMGYAPRFKEPALIFFLAASILLVISLLLKKMSGRIISYFVSAFFVISICFSVRNSFAINDIGKEEEIWSEYNELKTCEEMNNRFNVDLENNELKYFSFGLGMDKKLTRRLRKRYKIITFHEGCIVFGPSLCYNTLLNEHLKEKYNDDSIDFEYN